MNLFESTEIEKLQSALNSKENAPRRGYRRNVSVYELLCYVNNLVACYVSKNEEPMPIFIHRCRQHMEQFPAGEEWPEYYELVSQYVGELECHLQACGIEIKVL